MKPFNRPVGGPPGGTSVNMSVLAVLAAVWAFLMLSCGDAKRSEVRTLSAVAIFDLRSKCSELARKIEQEIQATKAQYPGSVSDTESVTNRYDETSNRCYIEQFGYHMQTANNGEWQVMEHRIVSDAQQRNVLSECRSYVHKTELKAQVDCTNGEGKRISLSEANAIMNRLMNENFQWQESEVTSGPR